MTLLHRAIIFNRVASIRTLLAAGADAGHYWRGQTPLFAAATLGHIWLVRLLHEHNANLDDASRCSGDHRRWLAFVFAGERG